MCSSINYIEKKIPHENPLIRKKAVTLSYEDKIEETSIAANKEILTRSPQKSHFHGAARTIS